MGLTHFLNGFLMMLLVSTLAFSAEDGGKDLFSVATKVSGSYYKTDNTVTIHGKVYEKGFYTFTYNYIQRDNAYVVLDIRGWDYLTFSVAIPDDGIEKNEFAVKIDADEVWRQTVKIGEVPLIVTLDISGHDSITLIANECAYEDSAYGGFMEPELYKGEPPLEAVKSTETGPINSPGVTPATFAVDPKDLDTLATNLRSSVDEDKNLKSKVDNGQIAIMTFTLVDIPSSSVATNVAEDLTTAMIQKKFFLVERDQLDNVLKELEIQDSGLVDPDTAKEIGNLTGCDLILLGSISDRGQFVVINARLMETETGKSVVAQRVEMRKIPIG